MALEKVIEPKQHRAVGSGLRLSAQQTELRSRASRWSKRKYKQSRQEKGASPDERTSRHQ